MPSSVSYFQTKKAAYAAGRKGGMLQSIWHAMRGGPKPNIESHLESQPSPEDELAEGPTENDQSGVRRRASRQSAEKGKEEKPEKPKKDRTFFKHIEPKEPFTARNQIQRTLLGSYINILLFAAPVGIAINYIHSVSRVAVFVVNFIAIIPLAAMLSFATEEIALRTGETLGGLLNASFGYVE